MLNAAFTVIVIAALLTMALSWLARKMLFPAPTAPSVSAAEGRDDVEVVHLPCGTEAWFLAPDGDRQREGGRAPLIVFTHGNGELIDHWLDEFKEPRTWGVGVLLVEYPGYGRSGGSPSEKSIRRTMAEAHDWILGREDIDRERIVAYGRSLGGGAATQLADQRPVAALILESTFTSVRRIARDMGAPGFLVRDPFDNLGIVTSYQGPIVGFHGTADRVIPVRHAHDLERAGADYQLFTLGCGHNDCPRQWPTIERFLAERGLLRAPAE